MKVGKLIKELDKYRKELDVRKYWEDRMIVIVDEEDGFNIVKKIKL